MSNICSDVKHPFNRYKGKSMEFSGNWAEGVRYFNDEFITSFVVYTDDDIGGNALLGCKINHISKKDKNDFTTFSDNQPHLEYDSNNNVVGLKPNNYWIFICGSIKGDNGKSHTTVENVSDVYALANKPSNIGLLVFVKSNQKEYVITNNGVITEVITGNEIQKLQETKVDKVEGKGLSTEDYTTEDKNKLHNIEDGAQKNVIESISVNGVRLGVINKAVNITTMQDKYSMQKMSVPVGNYFASYTLTKNGNKTGDTINIPRDTTIYSGVINEVIENGKPYIGATIGDMYIDIILNDVEKSHIYIPAKKLMDIYSGDKYIDVNYSTKIVSLKYDALKTDLKNNLELTTKNIDGLENRLSALENPNSKVESLKANGKKATGQVNLDEKFFEIQPTTNIITLKAVQFESAGVAEEVRNQLTGSPDDNIEDTMTLYSLKNEINNINTYGITVDEIGKGLEYNTFDKKLNVNVKDNSSLIINDDNKIDLIWK